MFNGLNANVSRRDPRLDRRRPDFVRSPREFVHVHDICFLRTSASTGVDVGRFLTFARSTETVHLRSSAATVDVSDDVDEPASRSVSTMDVSSGVHSCRR